MAKSRWTGADGTEYLVVERARVRDDQPRWWIGLLPKDGDTVCGPAHPGRLHKLTIRACGLAKQPPEFALVLPS